MSKVNHDLRSNKGRTIYMPEYYSGESGWANLDIPNVYAADDASPLYPRETRLVTGNRVFYYGTYNGVVTSTGTSVTATNGDDLAGKFLFSYATQDDMATGLLVRKLANELHIVYNTTISKTPAARAEDYYSGGWVTGKDTAPSDERMFGRRIVKHTYQATGTSFAIFNSSTGLYTLVDLTAYTFVSILELDQPVINAKTTMATTICANEYKEVCWQNDTAYAGYMGSVGACMHNDPTATRSVWLQTYGDMFMPHYEAEAIGSTSNERTLVLNSDGSVQGRTASYDRFSSFRPIVGYLKYNTIFASGSGANEGLPMMFVTLKQ
ncbi:hypothetical protein LCGC14_2108230 [marine sediment metagenome]|uniref:Uncharacterized protein n=1 Tax=marine sediment metagenome TaxID=412755 RepID=A0A0F9E7S3_9ZZZZ